MVSVFTPTAPLPPAPAEFNMAAYVLAHAARLADKTALRILSADHSEDWSFQALETATLGVAQGLLDAGLVPGDHVLLRLGNRVEFPLAFLGAIAAGLVPIPTSSQLTAPEITKMAQLVKPAAIICDPTLSLPVQTEAKIITTDALGAMTKGKRAAYHMGDPERPAYIIFTSGTSGAARAVMHAHRAIWARQMMWDGWYGLGQSDRVLHAGAFNWTYTLGTGLMDPWSVGATALVPAQGTAPRDLGTLLAQTEASIFAAAPGVYRQMLRADLGPLPALRHGLSAGEKLPEQIRADWIKRTHTPIHEAFGMSECSTFISSSPARPAPTGTLGYPQAGRHIAVLNAQSAPCRDDEPGLLAVHKSDPGLMLGYFGADAATAAKFQGDWFVTGDTVSMTLDGALRYEGRTDDIMNAGGFRVSPIEVETTMAKHPAIAEAACVEVEIKADTTVIACFYVAVGDQIDEQTLSDFAHENLAHYKCPRLFRRIDGLPRNANNKILRSKLRLKFESNKLT